MKRGTMINVTHKEFELIKIGKAKFIFKNFPLNGKVYLFENKGKRKKGYCLGNCEDCQSASWGCNGWEQDEPSINGCARGLIPYHPDLENLYEGQGKVVAEMVVKECYEYYEEYGDSDYERANVSFKVVDKQIGVITKEKEILNKQGYTNQKYAIEITDLIVYDEPLDITEFIGWNKVEKLIKDNYTKYERKAWKTHLINEIIDGLINYEDNQCNLSHAPQGKVFVVEKEE